MKPISMVEGDQMKDKKMKANAKRRKSFGNKHKHVTRDSGWREAKSASKRIKSKWGRKTSSTKIGAGNLITRMATSVARMFSGGGRRRS